MTDLSPAELTTDFLCDFLADIADMVEHEEDSECIAEAARRLKEQDHQISELRRQLKQRRLDEVTRSGTCD